MEDRGFGKKTEASKMIRIASSRILGTRNDRNTISSPPWRGGGWVNKIKES
jgi:hypothetical protein